MNSIFGNVDDLYLFCSVVEQGSLLAAAKKLELPVSTMSRRLSALEARLGLRLLEKKGRELVATETGLQAFDQLSSAMAQIESGILQLNQQSQQVEGRIRLVMPSRFYNDLVDKVVEDYIKTYPKVTIDLLLSQVNSIPETDRDLVVTFDLDGLDDMIARPLFKVEHAFFVSPEYLAQAGGNIETLQDLAKQDWVASTHTTQVPIYQQDKLVDMLNCKPRLVVNDITAVIKAVENGLGIASIPLRHVKPELNLVRVAPSYSRGDREAYLVYRQRNYQPKALTLMVEAILQASEERNHSSSLNTIHSI
ncbi:MULTISPECIES: LysR family transcriptional regulator [Vibrio harveyi group]|uniref:LysR family transcriptional regulator n=1 Tax=Vibrio jasicida TaxID=766224 RepID=A0ABW7JCP2_9VIBR|nr:LysR family transcriptional regulator [Vibrio rotiferianus]PIB13708.1 transcriptional regulator [Vibrio rotiferianus CAIM 577 = LMG 21460]